MVEREEPERAREHLCKIQAIAIFNIKTRTVFPAYVLSYMHVCVCSLYGCDCVCYHAIAGSVFDFRLRVFEVSCQEGMTEC
jgi:hypothetical protein